MRDRIKIIGRTGGGFIVDFPDDTLYYLVGIYRHESDRRLEVGDEIALGEIFTRLRAINHNRKRIDDAVGALRRVIDSVTLVDPIVFPDILDGVITDAENEN